MFFTSLFYIVRSKFKEYHSFSSLKLLNPFLFFLQGKVGGYLREASLRSLHEGRIFKSSRTGKMDTLILCKNLRLYY